MTLNGISSMATKALLAELSQMAHARLGIRLDILSIGGVDAAKRVQAGEAFDMVVLASDAIGRLAAAGHVLADSVADLVRSDVAMAIPKGRPRVDLRSEDDLKTYVLAQKRLSYSTGPSGVALAKLFERWGVQQVLAERIVTPPPGVAVASLVAKGEVDLGFQQTSEMLHVSGIELLGALPADVAITTTFTASVGIHCQQPDAVREVLAFWASADCDAAKHAQGMRPARP